MARSILARLGESGQPPEVGIEFLDTGNETALRVLEEEYLEPMADSGRGSAFKLIQGSFGTGKTHFLYCVRRCAARHGMLVALVTLSPGECPFDEPHRVYAAVAREIRSWSDAGEATSSRGIDVILRQILDRRLTAASEEEARDLLLKDLRRLRTDSAAYRMAVARFFFACLDGEEDAEDLTAAYLRGEPVPREDLKSLGIHEEIRRTSGFRALRSLCQTLSGLGQRGILLAFDEGDRNLSLPTKRRRKVADHLRQLIDMAGQEVLPGTLILYAVPPEFMNDVVPEYVALQQRLAGPGSLRVRSPQAMLLDIESSNLPVAKLLPAIGGKLLEIAQVAFDEELDLDLQRGNLDMLASAIATKTWHAAPRRLFVKTAVHLLHDQRGRQRSLRDFEIHRFFEPMDRPIREGGQP